MINQDPFDITNYILSNKTKILDFLHSFNIYKETGNLLLNVIDRYEEISLSDFLYKYVHDYRSVYVSIPGLLVFKVPKNNFPVDLKNILPVKKCGLMLDNEFAYIYGNFDEQSRITLSYLGTKYEILDKLPFPGPEFDIRNNLDPKEIVLSELKFSSKIIVDIIYSLETNIQVLKNITTNVLDINLNFDIETKTENRNSIDHINSIEKPVNTKVNTEVHDTTISNNVEDIKTESFNINDHFQYIRIDPENMEMNNDPEEAVPENDVNGIEEHDNGIEDNLTWDDYIAKCNNTEENTVTENINSETEANTITEINTITEVNTITETETNTEPVNEIVCDQFDESQRFYDKYKNSPYYDDNIEDYNTWIYYAHGVKIPVDLDFDILTSIVEKISNEESNPTDYHAADVITENTDTNKIEEDPIADPIEDPIADPIEDHHIENHVIEERSIEEYNEVNDNVIEDKALVISTENRKNGDNIEIIEKTVDLTEKVNFIEDKTNSVEAPVNGIEEHVNVIEAPDTSTDDHVSEDKPNDTPVPDKPDVSKSNEPETVKPNEHDENKPKLLSKEELKAMKPEDFEVYANYMWLLYGITISGP